MDQKRYAKHLAKKKASHSRRLGRYQQQLAALPPTAASEAAIDTRPVRCELLPPPVVDAALAAAIEAQGALEFGPAAWGWPETWDEGDAAEAPDLCLCGAPMVGPGQCSAPDCVCNVATSEAPE